MRSGYGSTSEIQLNSFVFDGIFGVALVKRTITVAEDELGPVGKTAYCRVWG